MKIRHILPALPDFQSDPVIDKITSAIAGRSVTLPAYLNEALIAIDGRLVKWINSADHYASMVAIMAIAKSEELQKKLLAKISKPGATWSAVTSDIGEKFRSSGFVKRLTKLYNTPLAQLIGDPHSDDASITSLIPLLYTWRQTIEAIPQMNWSNMDKLVRTLQLPASYAKQPAVVRAAVIVSKMTGVPVKDVISNVESASLETSAILGNISNASRQLATPIEHRSMKADLLASKPSISLIDAKIEGLHNELKINKVAPMAQKVPASRNPVGRPPMPADDTPGHTPPFTVADAKDAIRRLASRYPLAVVATVERMARLETRHFKSEQYQSTGSAAMEWSKAWGKPITQLPKHYHWDKGNKFVKPGWKPFVVWPNVFEAMKFLADYIVRNRGDFTRWNSTTPEAKAAYAAKVNAPGLQPKFTAEIAAAAGVPTRNYDLPSFALGEVPVLSQAQLSQNPVITSIV